MGQLTVFSLESRVAASTDTTSQSTENKTGVSGMAPSTAWSGSAKAAKRKRRFIIRTTIIAILAVAYAIGTWYFSSHFTPGTTVDGVDASLMTTDQLADAIQDRAASYEQHITNEDGFDLTITSGEIGLSTEGTQVATEALARTNPVLWLPQLISPKHMLIDAQVESDEEALATIVNNAVESYNRDAEQPTNATGTYDEESKSFVVAPEAVGTALDADKVTEKVETAYRELSPNLSLDETVLLQPKVNSEDEKLAAAIEKANGMIAKDLAIMCDGEQVSTADKKTIVSWISFTDDQEVNVDGVMDWVEANQKVKIAGNATDEEHVWALDANATCSDIHRALEKEPGTDAQVKRTAIETKPAATPGAKERGRHLDVNLSTQFVRFYDEDGKVIWDSYCVTGGWDSEYQEMHATPQGTYHIQAKDTNTTLVGADRNDDKKPDYESFVYYWMPFLNYDYGFHDATWRSDFGGDIRYWWGSHGCINLPFEKAEELFNLVKVGDTVYIHE